MPNDQTPRSITSRWRDKFACAFRGVNVGVRGNDSFAVHIPAAIAVLALAAWLDCSLVELLVLILCITAVIAAELFNTALEHLSRAITREEHPEIRDALDIAAGAVLVTAIGAKVVWVMVLAGRLLH